MDIQPGDIVLKTHQPVKLGACEGGLSKKNGSPWGKAEFFFEGGSFALQCTPEQATQYRGWVGKQVNFVALAKKEKYGPGAEFHLVQMTEPKA